MNLEKCPNCGKSVKGFLSADLIPQEKTDFINKYHEQNKEAYCTTCAGELILQVGAKMKQQKSEIENRLESIIHNIPLLTTNAPANWDYEVIGMVTSQITTGTGFSTELSRSFNDFFGSVSKTSNRKVDKTNQLCKADLRVQCVKSLGNAIIGTSIQFNEIGSGSTNMLMVSMSGTAIKLKNISNSSIQNSDLILEIFELTEKLEAISDVK